MAQLHARLMRLIHLYHHLHIALTAIHLADAFMMPRPCDCDVLHSSYHHRYHDSHHRNKMHRQQTSPLVLDSYPISHKVRCGTVQLHASSKSNKAVREDASFSVSFDNSQHKDLILIRCLLAIVMYMAVGVVSYSRIFEKWPIVDAIYFSVVTFTTVG